MINYQDNLIELHQGHVLDVLREMPAELVHCVVTSPPYWGLRDYGLEPQVWLSDDFWDSMPNCEHEWGEDVPPRRSRHPEDVKNPASKQATSKGSSPELPNTQFCRHCQAWKGSLGLEPTPELYIQHIVQVFAEVKRVLRKDGVCWVNLGDSYAGSGCGTNDYRTEKSISISKPALYDGPRPQNKVPIGLKAKDLCMIPARVALALQAEGWWLRSDIIWNKPNPMPESVTDRPTRSHEYVFLLTKSAKYFYDAEAVKETSVYPDDNRKARSKPDQKRMPTESIAGVRPGSATYPTRNLRSVWTIPTQPFPQAHFATFPEKLASICIKAGTSEKGCCPECGGPWVRILEKKHVGDNLGKRTDNPRAGIRGSGLARPPAANEIEQSKTIGWKPSCECYQKKTIGALGTLNKVTPCTVLDPFAGSCRALIVAKKLGRRGIGIDLKGEYLEMPKKELSQEVMEF